MELEQYCDPVIHQLWVGKKMRDRYMHKQHKTELVEIIFIIYELWYKFLIISCFVNDNKLCIDVYFWSIES